MTKNPDHKARAELLARQLNARLAAEGLGMQARRDRRALARDARAETAERRRMIEMRRRPSYAASEARQPFEARTRLIPATNRSHDAETHEKIVEPPTRPTYEQMRAQRDEYPDMPMEVREHERRRREQRRARNRAGSCKKK